MKALFFPKISRETDSKGVSMALLAIRVIVGVAFLVHGSGKIVAPFNWMGPDAPVPGILQALAAVSEFGGGLALILGLLTPIASLGIVPTMVVAVFFHLSKGDGFVGGYELALVYLTLAGSLFLTGPGRYSLDAFIGEKVANSESGELSNI